MKRQLPVLAMVWSTHAHADAMLTGAAPPAFPSRVDISVTVRAQIEATTITLALPPITLGTYSVDRRSSFAGSGLGATARAVTGELDFVDVGAAQSFDAALAQLTARGGEPISLEGIVTVLCH